LGDSVKRGGAEIIVLVRLSCPRSTKLLAPRKIFWFAPAAAAAALDGPVEEVGGK